MFSIISSKQVMASVTTHINTGKSWLWTVDNFTPDYYDDYLKDLKLTEKPEIVICGRTCHQQRDVDFFSDSSEGYRYSGNIRPARPLADCVLFAPLLDAVNEALGSNFNGLLVNRYCNGSEYIGAHSDEESGLSSQKMVASIAYGPGIRTFRVRDKKTKKVVLDLPHQPCTLLVMQGEFQSEFTHEIPQQKRILEPRVSLTFRSHTV